MQDTLIRKDIREREAINANKYNILYVDDEDINLRLFKVTFKRHFNVITASTGREALELLKQNDIKLILTDQQMPGMLGTELLEKTIAEFPDIIRIIVTGFADISAIAKAVNKCGIYKYITKPWDNGELKITMDKALESYELKNDKNNLIRELEDVNASLEQKVADRTRALTEANDRLMSGLIYAETIQQAILPKRDKFVQRFADAFIIFKPKEHVSGDFIWHATVTDAEGDIEVVAAIDCVGHGVAGALLTMIGESLLQKIVNEKRIIQPKAILQQMNEGLHRSLAHTANRGYETMDGSILTVDKNKGVAYFAGASQNLIYFSNGEMEILKGSRLHIGGENMQDLEFTQDEIKLDAVESIYLQSDGYRDQLSEKGKIGTKRLKELLSRIQDRSMTDQGLILEKFFDQWKGGEEQTDDVTLLGLKV